MVRIFLFLLLFATCLHGQDTIPPLSRLGFSVSLALQQPVGVMGERFGTHTAFGAGLEYLNPTNKWTIGANAAYLFGTNVKEDIIAPLRDKNGEVLNTNESYAFVNLRLKGYDLAIFASKLQLLKKQHYLKYQLGVGLLQHQVDIRDLPYRSTPQFSGDYRKGYDRLTNGVSLTPLVGYQQIGKTNTFFIAAFATAAYTQNRRGFNYEFY